ncbi:TadE/TadG family type IV pilus assembly protein [Archangium lansingense]|uniref:TadE/TadG family type IV pilus assembly protein n=1 Tax=Archangium lansingense TaxID=2995310 RepID=UPI003B7C2F16
MSEHPQVAGQSGQAAVESALVLPLMVFLGLGLLQLTLMQQAKLMTEYAAYCAARSGIVWNGNNERMRDAALVALLPTLGRTDGLPSLAKTWTRARLQDEMLRQLAWPTRDSVVPTSVNGSPLFGLVRVDTVNPSWYSPVRSVWKLRSAMDWKELDFDGPDGYPQVPALESKLARFFNLALPDDAEEVYRKATVLSVRVRYWYELRVPFANWLIFSAWWAANAGVTLGGAIHRPTKVTAPVRGLEHQRGYASLYRQEMSVLKGLATGRRYFFPLTATYSLRMQSNFYFKWLMHLNPDWGL